ncbi:sulfite exporter TauE/SafE family protein [Pseudorhodoplanes sp.]|uniref:sulfite exporter TauE/SafE family protein n=1 Tax=Pseudorhodoplanes sp. TaxID=1934341 RepID=UPI003D0E9B13
MQRRRHANALAREFAVQQLPMIAVTLALGFLVAYMQYGYIPGADRPFPIAGVRVSVWHLIVMGVVTGYLMTLVGQAAGILALPYSTSVLQFTNPHVSSTMLVLTFIGPAGALLGFRRSGQWNIDFAWAVCLGGAVGAFVGPLFRATVLANADVFRLTLGIALGLFGLQLCWKAVRDYTRTGATRGHDFMTPAEDGKPMRFSIKTLERGLLRTRIRFGSHERTLSNHAMFVIGAAVGAFSAALGVGGGFLLVPIFATVYRLPLYVMVAATIPYTIVLSLIGILTFTVILPVFAIPSIAPEWSWGLFAAAGGLLGSWVASKSQLLIAEHLLNWLLGGITVIAGALYVLSFAFELPFAL